MHDRFRVLGALAAAALALCAVGCKDSSSPSEPTDPDRPLVSVAAAAATITESDMRRWVNLLADDSMRGRATPSPEIEEAASAVAAHFRQVGLRPAFGDSFTQRFPAVWQYGRISSYGPNVGGVLEGSDADLEAEYVVFMAHTDHIGVDGSSAFCHAVGADSICNGADDNASGTAGLVELAEAFAALNPRPRRSLLFLAVSGEELGLVGSKYFVDHTPVALGQIAAVINLDMIGRNATDSILVGGLGSSTIEGRARAVVAEHPEERMRFAGIPSVGSDEYPFVQRGIPALAFFNGRHGEYHKVTDATDKIDVEKAARVVRMVFYVGADVASLSSRPTWIPLGASATPNPAASSTRSRSATPWSGR